jgi:multiple sugar transport system substrate-binding protein
MLRRDQIRLLGEIGAAGYRMNRRRLLQVGAAASGMAAFGLIPSKIRAGHFVQANATLNVLAPQWPQNAKEESLAEAWSQESGIAVNFEAVNYASLEQRVKILVESQSADYDIYDYDSQWIGGFVAVGALERLDTDAYLNSGSATVSMEDFYPEITGRVVRYPSAGDDLTAGGNTSPVYGLPWSLNCEVLWYRKDLMDAPPATWDELRARAQELTTDGMYGYAVQGGRDADWIISEFAPIAWSNGGELWDPSTYTAQGILNSETNVAALQFLADMVNVDQSIDPASANWTINERLGALLTGAAAMCLNWSPLFGGVADGPDSAVAGNVGYAVSPAGTARQSALIGCQGTGINGFSQQKDAAWQYLQFWQSRDNQAALMADLPSGFVSARNDLRDQVTEEWQQVFLDSIPHLKDIWNIPEYAQLLQILQTELNLSYVGQKSPQDALDDAALAQQAILDGVPPENRATGESMAPEATPVS